MQGSKYLGKTYDAYWTVASIKRKPPKSVLYVLRNDYNGTEVMVNGNQMKRIADGKAPVSKIVFRRIKSEERKERGHSWNRSV